MMLTSPALARNYLKSDGLFGPKTAADEHEDQIDIHDIAWKMRPSRSGDKGDHRDHDRAQPGAGVARRLPQTDPLPDDCDREKKTASPNISS